MCSVMAGLTALGGYFQYKQQAAQIQSQANAQASMYRAQAEVAQQNARIENRKQEQIADNYAQKQEELRSRRRLIEGSQRAETGSAGLGFSGSAMDILSSGYDAYGKDAMNLLMNQRNDNYNSRVTETNYLHQANQANQAAGNVLAQAKRQKRMLGISTILGTAASVYGAAQPWKSAGRTASASSNTSAFYQSPNFGAMGMAQGLNKPFYQGKMLGYRW
ncbi:hypothetical protein TAMA11512_09210 [Selenomonas sp. TAMA-11512]|nr:hypothetical protein TAMA11512_09210 [Selenomonas sp. TAMA-11512]